MFGKHRYFLSANRERTGESVMNTIEKNAYILSVHVSRSCLVLYHTMCTSCTGIMTHHVAYTLQFEQAMQLVDPSVSIPYWEYTIECKMS